MKKLFLILSLAVTITGCATGPSSTEFAWYKEGNSLEQNIENARQCQYQCAKDDNYNPRSEKFEICMKQKGYIFDDITSREHFNRRIDKTAKAGKGIIIKRMQILAGKCYYVWIAGE